MIAHRVTYHEARHHFTTGGTVLVSQRAEESFPVGPSTTVHTQDTTSWEELTTQVRMWSNRYPRQRYYKVTP